MSSTPSTPKLDQSVDRIAGRTPCPASPHSDCDGFQYLDARAFAEKDTNAGPTPTWEMQSSPSHASSYPPRTPPRRRMSWAFRWNHGDPFFGAKEAKASPVAALCDAKTPPAAGGVLIRPNLPVPAGPVLSPSRSSLSGPPKSPLADRKIKGIPRILFPLAHQLPRSTLNARHMTKLRNYEYVSCCAGCYGSGLVCDKREKDICSQCEQEGKTSCNCITLAEQKKRDQW